LPAVRSVVSASAQKVILDTQRPDEGVIEIDAGFISREQKHIFPDYDPSLRADRMPVARVKRIIPSPGSIIGKKQIRSVRNKGCGRVARDSQEVRRIFVGIGIADRHRPVAQTRPKVARVEGQIAAELHLVGVLHVVSYPPNVESDIVLHEHI
jgi:hypothetical protein